MTTQGDQARPICAAGEAMPACLDDSARDTIAACHMTIAGFDEDIERFRFNRCVAALYTLTNTITDLKGDSPSEQWARRFGLETLAQLLAPIAPHTAEEMWQNLGHDTMLATLPWPRADQEWLVQDTITLPVQVNGKLRGNIDVSTDAPKEDVEKMALALPAVQKILEDSTLKKVIVVPNRIVNVVV
jgi:leucyl-tRNA synthetase